MVDIKELESFEQQFIELVGEYQTLSVSTSELREAFHTEAARAEAAAASRDSCERSSVHAQSNAAAALASATHALQKLAAVQEELTTVKMQLEFAEHERGVIEEKYVEMINKTSQPERELQILRPLQAKQATIERQYAELQERVQKAAEGAQSEASRLENELKRVERCASAGVELRERARLAAAAHARQRRLASAEIQHLTRELQTAKAEIARQTSLIAEMEYNKSKSHVKMSNEEFNAEALREVRAALEEERNGAKKIEKALAAATTANAVLAAELNKKENEITDSAITPECISTSVNNCPIDSFLAE